MKQNLLLQGGSPKMILEKCNKVVVKNLDTTYLIRIITK
jgi:hypothetical protein